MNWTAPALLSRGGVVMYLLLALSLLAAAIVLLKLYHFARLRLRRLEFVNGAIDYFSAGDTKVALDILGATPNPVARVIEAAIHTTEDDAPAGRAEVEVSGVAAAEIRQLAAWLRALSSIAHLSPLLGLLGTVLGMISAFMELESAGPLVSSSVLSGGIWSALLTTAYGLIVAIPSMAAFYYFEGEVDRVEEAMREAGTRILVRRGAQPLGTAIVPVVGKLAVGGHGIG